MKLILDTNLTLDIIWIECLKMWKSICRSLITRKWKRRILKYGLSNTIEVLKIKYSNKHFSKYASCLFCYWTLEQQKASNCSTCPAKKVDPNFNCFNENYAWDTKPFEFRKKLVELNKIRKQHKKGKIL